MSDLMENATTTTTWPKTCWSPECDDLIAVIPGVVTYWCERHHHERRERIKAAMSRLENDSYGIPRKRPDAHDTEVTSSPIAHDINIQGEYSEWRWACKCGKGSAAPASTEGMARAASYRHLRAVEKAEARV